MIVIYLTNICENYLFLKLKKIYFLFFYSEFYLSTLIKFESSENVINEWRKFTPYVILKKKI